MDFAGLGDRDDSEEYLTKVGDFSLTFANDARALTFARVGTARR
jgi:hypothetical protein